MLLRYFRIREFLDDTDADLFYNMPTPVEVNELNLAMADLNIDVIYESLRVHNVARRQRNTKYSN